MLLVPETSVVCYHTEMALIQTPNVMRLLSNRLSLVVPVSLFIDYALGLFVYNTGTSQMMVGPGNGYLVSSRNNESVFKVSGKDCIDTGRKCGC